MTTLSVDILDNEFSVEEFSQAIKHLIRAKAAGHNDIKGDYILCEKNNPKYVIKAQFNK